MALLLAIFFAKIMLHKEGTLVEDYWVCNLFTRVQKMHFSQQEISELEQTEYNNIPVDGSEEKTVDMSFLGNSNSSDYELEEDNLSISSHFS